MDKKVARTRRSRRTRVRIALQRTNRLVVARSNCHIYAQIIAPTGDRVLASASKFRESARVDRLPDTMVTQLVHVVYSSSIEPPRKTAKKVVR